MLFRPEVVAVGHDRCKPEPLDAWLNPDRSDLPAVYTILDGRPRTYYEHQVDKAA